jgi:hypothetical protein
MANTSNIREHMEVVGSCGKRVGTVVKVDGNSLELTRNGPQAGGEHHFVPLDWVASVDQSVQLSKPCRDVQEEWQAHPIAEGDYSPDEK